MRVNFPRFARLALVAALTLGAGGCGSATGPQPDFGVARARWAQRAPASYTMVVVRSCECLPGAAGAVLVSVRNGVVESRAYQPSGTAVVPEYAALFPDVQGLFALIDAAIRNGTHPLEARYHPALGFPTRVALGDPAVDAPLYVVSEFRPR